MAISSFVDRLEFQILYDHVASYSFPPCLQYATTVHCHIVKLLFDPTGMTTTGTLKFFDEKEEEFWDVGFRNIPSLLSLL